MSKQEAANGHAGKVTVPGKPLIQIRETSNGVITLAGSTEVSVSTYKEMAACLEQGSLSRATGSTNMNNQSRFIMTTYFLPLIQHENTVFPNFFLLRIFFHYSFFFCYVSI